MKEGIGLFLEVIKKNNLFMQYSVCMSLLLKRVSEIAPFFFFP